jgi:hypothetical protein
VGFGEQYCSKCGDSLVCGSCKGTDTLTRFLNLIPGNIVVPGGNSEIIVQVVVHPLNQLIDCQMIGNALPAMALEGTPHYFCRGF